MTVNFLAGILGQTHEHLVVLAGLQPLDGRFQLNQLVAVLLGR